MSRNRQQGHKYSDANRGTPTKVRTGQLVPSSGWALVKVPAPKNGKGGKLAARRRGLCSRQSTRRWIMHSCVAVPQRAKRRGDCARREQCCRRPYRQVEGVSHSPAWNPTQTQASVCLLCSRRWDLTIPTTESDERDTWPRCMPYASACRRRQHSEIRESAVS